jgi:hypothetical protein
VLAFPCFLSGLLALPLCGAAPTFLCRRKEKQPYWKSSGEPALKVEAVSRREHFARASRPRDLHD